MGDEYYDFFIYATAAALVFDKVFFPALRGHAGDLVSLSTFAVAFLVRPLGGVICGHFGDKWGRRPMLVLTLSLMGLATLAIGLLPDYHTIGVAAPVLLILLRILQGFAMGGELGGAVLLTMEHTPPRPAGGLRQHRADRRPARAGPLHPGPAPAQLPAAGRLHVLGLARSLPPELLAGRRGVRPAPDGRQTPARTLTRNFRSPRPGPRTTPRRSAQAPGPWGTSERDLSNQAARTPELRGYPSGNLSELALAGHMSGMTRPGGEAIIGPAAGRPGR